MKKIVLLLLTMTGGLQSETGFLYKKKYASAKTEMDQILIDHTEKSLQRTVHDESNLTESILSKSKSLILTCFDHLMSNVCSLPNNHHLHIGLEFGKSFISSLLGNEEQVKTAIGIDIFGNQYVEDTCRNNCRKYLTASYKIFKHDCFTFDKSLIKTPINIYMYDADHSQRAHRDAYLYYNEVLETTFITVVDDWDWEQVRKGTFEAFEELGYTILYENYLPKDHHSNGVYIAVIRK